MAKRYVMTPARRAALHKAQLASAKKRRKKKNWSRLKKGAKIAAIGTGSLAGTIVAINGAYIITGKKVKK